MRQTSRSTRLPRQAIAGAALAALLAWAPFGTAVQAPAYADEPEAWIAAEESFATGEDATGDETAFGAALPEGEAYSANDDETFLAGEDADTAGENGSLVGGDDVIIADAAVCPDAEEGIAAQASSSVAYDGTLAVRADKSYALAWQVLDLVNQERAKQGLSPLTMDADLLDAAMLRAAEAAVCFNHTRPSGESCFTACSKMTRENIAYGVSTAQGAMYVWMNSDGHRANILSSETKSIGIGCVRVNGAYYWVQCFGAAKATSVSKPADASNALVKVPYTKTGLSSLGSRFKIIPITLDGSRPDFSASGALQQDSSQRYALCVYPFTDSNKVTRIDDSCITWSLSGTGAKLNASTSTVTATGSGSFTLTASVGGGTVKQTLTRKTEGAPTSFKDVASGEWYTSWVTQAAKAGLMTGHKGADGKYTGYFEPNGTITRAQVATVLWRIAGSPSASAGAFSDMSGHWAATAVAWCSAKGIVTGYTGGPDAGKFVPDRQVSRQELAVMVWRFAKWSGVKTANPPTAAFNSCGDAALVPDWSRQAMTWCAAAGVITGVQGGAKPMLCPQDGATRAMAAKIFVQTQKIASGAVSPYAEDGAADEAQAGPDEVTFDDVQDGAAVADEAFDAVEPGEAGTTGEAADGSGSKPEQADGTTGDATGEATGEPGQADGAGDISTDEPDEATGVAEYPGNDESAAADDPDVNATPADSADIAEPDAAADAFAEPAESEEAPAADVADGTGLTEVASFDTLDAIAA